MKTALFSVVFLALLTSCQVKSKHDDPAAAGTGSSTLVDAKYSVAKDRSEFDKLRETIPEDVRQKNDESALIAELTANLKYPPEVVREKFNNVLRKKRDLFNKDMNKSREQFNKQERKAREDFLKSLDEERQEFTKRKADRDKRSQFFNEQDEARRTYFAEQRDKREEFEADFREKRKNFEDYTKEKTDTFNAELKEYSLRWKEKQQQENPN